MREVRTCGVLQAVGTAEKRSKSKGFAMKKNMSTLLQMFVATALFVGTTGSALAQVKGATQLMPFKKVQTVGVPQSVGAGDQIAMSCPKCKDTYVTTVEKSFKGMNHETLKTARVHLCPGCETKVSTVGQGKAQTATLIHLCKNYGTKDVSCCAMKKNSGTTAEMQPAAKH
jgi:hypothetical protein